MNDRTVICFGEILWDVYPDNKIIGGAPLNVALRLHSYNVKVKIISCIGTDDSGKMVKEYLIKYGLSQELIQKHATLRTGSVIITLDEVGSACYEINKPVAWDAIQLTPVLIQAVKNAPFFLFGSLAVRGDYNRITLDRLLEVANMKIFDVNLRQPHYDISMVYELMQKADFVKLNDDELEEICSVLGCQEKDLKSQINWLMHTTNTNSICVTKGKDGAILYYKSNFYDHEGYKIKVKDTVGAGDSFLATLINELLLEQKMPQASLARSCAVGALVASKVGANCVVDEEEIAQLINKD
jgi:fructokinase